MGRKGLALFDPHSRGAILCTIQILPLWSIILTWDGDSLPLGQPVAIMQGVTGAGLLQELWKS